ncbi:MAG: FAD-dependent oxidoreductase [Desulfatibacillaceae bacterium]|nr:FAD-dependent oxidoreductase [Desulfatibacillaceae bacterium]
MFFIGKKPNLSSRRIVVAGANFAGLCAARAIPAGWSVTVLDPNPFFEFLPNIHEVISRRKSPESLRLDKAAIIKRAGHKWIAQRVAAILPDKKQVVCDAGNVFEYDALILAVGGENNTFGIEGAAQYAMPFKCADHCAAINRRLENLVHRQKGIKVVIVGGGLEGVEALGEILRAFGRHPGIKISVVEGQNRLLPEAPPVIDPVLRRHCKGLAVEFLTGERVAQVKEGKVFLASGKSLETDITLWTGGAKAPDLLYESGLAQRPGAWAEVDKHLASKAHPSIFVAGDAAQLESALPKQAYHAMDMGRLAAQNAMNLLGGKELATYSPSAKPALISFGEMDAFAVSGNKVFAGTIFNAAKEAVYQLVMTRMDSSRPPTRAARASWRGAQGALNLALGSASSLSSLLALGKIRALR